MDLILKNIIQKAIVETQERTGYLLTEEQALSIIDSQSQGIRMAMDTKGIAKINYLGKFTIKKGREEAINASQEAARLGLTGEERVAFLKEQKEIYLRQQQLEEENDK